jgi:hypothetical protein
MQTASVELLNNGSATSTGKAWPGGKGVFAVKGTFGGGTVALQFQLPDYTTWFTPTNGSLTDDGGFVFELPPCLIRAEVVTATAVYAMAARIPA